MLSLQTYVSQGRSTLRKLAVDRRAHTLLRAGAHILAGFCFSAASLAHSPIPIAMGLVCALSGWSGALAALGSCLGYWVFWGSGQGIAWTVAAGILTLASHERKLFRQTQALLPAAAGLVVAALGVLFQGTDPVSVPMYLLRIALGGGCTWLFSRVLASRNPILEWVCWGIATLALAQVVPIPGFSLGFPLAGGLMVAGAFPAAALAGLALDLAQVTPVPMTAVMAMGFALRFLPSRRKLAAILAPGMFYVLVMTLCGHWDTAPIPGLVLGGVLGCFRPLGSQVAHRRGETGAAQVRLELAAGVMSQVQQQLLEFSCAPIDEDALVARAAERACSGCPCRRPCKDARRIGQLPGILLHKSLLAPEELPVVCRKSGRFLAELHRSQEQLRSIRADRERQTEYRAALTQQYQFLAAYLQGLSDQLSRRVTDKSLYTPAVWVYGNRPEADNGDRCLKFPGTGNQYYVLLCDGMGTGLGAVREGKTAGNLLRRLLSAGFPPEHALRTLNSLCALRERAGSVTVDLCQLQLDTGRAVIYKWGAAPSYLVGRTGAQRLGAPSAPPGLSVTDHREITEQASLKRGELLVLCSDGAQDSQTLRICINAAGQEPAILGQQLLENSRLTGEDDATVVIIRLKPS